MKFSETVNGVTLFADFKDKVCIFDSDSGTGKTYLFSVIHAYCLSHGISVANINYHMPSFDEGLIIESCKNAKVVIFDNADLYLSNDIISKVYDSSDLILIAIKDAERINFDAGIYYVDYTSDKLEAVRY